MHVNTVTLSHFRNYTHAHVVLDARPVVVLGANGAGKTNILEAVSLLTAGRGMRRAAMADLDNVNSEATWVISAEIEGKQGLAAIGTGRDATKDGRIIKIDGKVARLQTELNKLFSVLWLTPQMDNLFLEGNSERRKFIDRLVFSFDTEHATRINHYEKVMRERNRLLQESIKDNHWLSALEDKMAKTGITIATARSTTIERLNATILLGNEAFPKAHITMQGEIESNFSSDYFKAVLQNNRMQDAVAGRCLAGVHRTQINVYYAAKNMPAELCSTGQQKALLISIILAQGRAGAQFYGHVPVMLLDEVTTHLDVERRNALYAELETLNTQAWLTGTDRSIFDGLNAQFLMVEDGHIVKMQ